MGAPYAGNLRTVRWYVIGRDGQKYGPADLPTLQMWASENRVRPDTMLEEEGTGAQVLAQSVAGLTFLPGSSRSASTPSSSPATPRPQPSTPLQQPSGQASQPTSGSSTFVEKWFVIAPNGQKYGPADLPMLQRWADEGRVTPQTLLEEEIGGRRHYANTLPGLVFRQGVAGANPWAQPPGASPYPRAGYYAPQTTTAGSGDLTAAWVLMILGFLCCLPLCFVAIYFADKARRAGNPGGQAAFIVAIVLSVLAVLANILSFALLGAGTWFDSSGY